MDSQRPPLLAMMLLREPAMPDPDAVAARLEARCGERYHVRWENPAEGKKVEVRFFYVNGQRVDVALMPFPIPPGNWEDACARNSFWPEAAQVCQEHRAHLVITLFGEWGDPIRRHLLLTDFIAAVSEAADALAVCWGAGRAMQSAEFFRQQAAQSSADNLPLLLWVAFVLVARDGGPFVSTSGLDAFGVMEVEAGSAHLKPVELLEKVYDTAHYLCTRGPVLRDGDTIGGSAEERIRIRHARSVWDRPDPVIRLEIDAPKRGLLSRLFGR